MHSKQIIGKQDGDDMLKRLYLQVQSATSTTGGKGVNWRTGTVTNINKSLSGTNKGFTIDLEYEDAHGELDIEENIFPGRIRKAFTGPIHVGDVVKVQSEKTDLCEVIDLKKTEYELTSCSIRLENGKVEDQVPLNRLRDLDTMQPLKLKDLNVNKKIRVVQSSLAQDWLIY
jgi:hypothetical protein